MQAEAARHRRVICELQLRSGDAAVGRRLVVDLDLPGAIVRDHEHRRGSVSHGRVELDGVESERPVSRRDQHQAPGKGEAGRDPERHADADAAERPRIEVSAGRKADADKAEEVASIGDDDRVRRQLRARSGTGPPRRPRSRRRRCAGSLAVSSATLVCSEHRSAIASLGRRASVSVDTVRRILSRAHTAYEMRLPIEPAALSLARRQNG